MYNRIRKTFSQRIKQTKQIYNVSFNHNSKNLYFEKIIEKMISQKLKEFFKHSFQENQTKLDRNFNMYDKSQKKGFLDDFGLSTRKKLIDSGVSKIFRRIF